MAHGRSRGWTAAWAGGGSKSRRNRRRLTGSGKTRHVCMSSKAKPACDHSVSPNSDMAAGKSRPQCDQRAPGQNSYLRMRRWMPRERQAQAHTLAASKTRKWQRGIFCGTRVRTYRRQKLMIKLARPHAPQTRARSKNSPDDMFDEAQHRAAVPTRPVTSVAPRAATPTILVRARHLLSNALWNHAPALDIAYFTTLAGPRR